MTRIGTRKQVMARLKECKAKGCTVRHDKAAGWAEAWHNGVKVFWALEKGRGNPWLCHYTESDTVKWTNEEGN